MTLNGLYFLEAHECPTVLYVRDETICTSPPVLVPEPTVVKSTWVETAALLWGDAYAEDLVEREASVLA